MSERRAVTRRDFVRGTAGAAIGVSLFGVAWAEQVVRDARSARVIVVRDPDVLSPSHDVSVPVLSAMLAETLTRLTGRATPREAWRSLFRPEDVVGLVPTKALNPTHAELVDAVRSSLIAAGIPAERMRNAQGGPGKAEACTALICMPALKAHWLTGIGTVLKNYITYADHPSDYHDENNDRLGEIWLMPHVQGKTRLVLVDALRPLCDKGPQADPRYLWDYKGLIAGTDPVAVEAVGLRIITAKREALRGEPWPLSPPPLCVQMADKRYGLGTSRMDEIRLERAGWSDGLLI